MAGLFIWLFAVILWCAFGVVEQADHLAELLGEPLGTLVLTLSIVIIEVVLIAAVAFGSETAPTLGRDTMFAVLMIVLNAVVGLALLLGGLRHHEQAYNLQGAVAYLAVIIPLSVIALILPNFTQAEPGGSLTTTQAAFFSVFTVVLYGIFLVLQTGRHRGFFVESGPSTVAAAASAHKPRCITQLAPPLWSTRSSSSLPCCRSCFWPSNLTIGLTLPAILGIGLATGTTMVLGLDPTGVTLLALTLVLSTLTFSGPRTTVLEGTVHLVVFLVYIVLIFSP